MLIGQIRRCSGIRGFCLFYKILERGYFPWPTAKEGVAHLTQAQLSTLVEGIYRQRHKVENLFAKLKDWRRVATRYDRCAHTFFSAMCIAAAVIF